MLNKTPKAASAKTVSAPDLEATPKVSLGAKIAAILAVFLVGLVGAVLVMSGQPQRESLSCQIDTALETTELQVNGQIFTAEIARSGKEQTRGLSGRDCLVEGRAMLFPYERPGDYCYWMKEMNFAIDMIWLDDEKEVVTIKSKVSPETYPESFCPDRPAQYVVEVPAGTADELQLVTGQTIRF